ncbi:MAG: 1,6-anhydro-N-acetylmuramyl-L-alanine amidase AmpD [Gammaproteobacteria bacterium]|nr:1,6-anhydro-N-acetylmuramyl-L-alanine amidase AmpD [Gammaproteobacteria bacterium]
MFDIDEAGVVSGARQLSSPNFDERSCVGSIEDGLDLIVLHNISLPPQQYGADWIEKFFCNQLPATEHPYFAEICDLKVSAHLLINRSGELIQFVPLLKRAWHAGVSSYQGRERCNDFSIGIELEGSDDDPFEPVQYQMLLKVLRSLLAHYTNLQAEHIVGHSDIAPGRKTDPGPYFDWALLRNYLS